MGVPPPHLKLFALSENPHLLLGCARLTLALDPFPALWGWERGWADTVAGKTEPSWYNVRVLIAGHSSLWVEGCEGREPADITTSPMGSAGHTPWTGIWRDIIVVSRGDTIAEALLYVREAPTFAGHPAV